MPATYRLFTYAGNVHALQSLIAARYNGIEVEMPPFEMGKDNKTADFKAKSPMGKVRATYAHVAHAAACFMKDWGPHASSAALTPSYD